MARLELNELLIIADDLTGAMDVGAEFMACCDKIIVKVDGLELHDVAGALIINNSNTRRASPGEAIKRIDSLFSTMKAKPKVILKKIDSAFRGNIGEESSVMMKALDIPIAFCIPSMPDWGRYTIHGGQYVGNKPITELYKQDAVGEEIRSHLAADNIRLDDNTRLIASDLQNLHKIAHSFRYEPGGGRRLFVVLDSRSHNQIVQLLESIFTCFPLACYLLLGSQGLAKGLASFYPDVKQRHVHLETMDKSKPVLVINGSLTDTAKRQIMRLLAETCCCNICSPSAINHNGFKLSPITVLSSTAVNGTANCIKSSNYNAFCVNAAGIIEQTDSRRIAIIGGDTACKICRLLGIHTLELRYQVAPLVEVALAKARGGKEYIIATKGGTIGNEDTIKDMVRALRSL